MSQKAKQSPSEPLSETALSPADTNNPYWVLFKNSPRLVKEVLDGNEEIDKFLYAVFFGITNQAYLKRASIREIYAKVEPIGEESNLLKIHVDYGKGSDSVELKLLWERNMQIARVLELNRSVLRLAEEVVSVLQKWAARNNISIADIMLRDTMIPAGCNHIVAKLVTRSDFDYETANKLDATA